MPGGRPRNYTDEEIEQIKILFQRYIDESDIPILCKFAAANHIPRDTFYEYEELSTLTKECIDKKTGGLEEKALNGEINATMAIFSLKQLGWSDKTQSEITGNIQTTLSLENKMKIISEMRNATDPG